MTVQRHSAFQGADRSHFIAALRGEAELIAPASQAVACVRVIEAAYQSARTGRSVSLLS
jgi:predicted dehydrogenase